MTAAFCPGDIKDVLYTHVPNVIHKIVIVDLVRVGGIEPPLSRWQRDVLPLNDTRVKLKGSFTVFLKNDVEQLKNI